MRTEHEILKDLRKYSQELTNCKKEDYQIVLVQYNIIIKELDDYYKIYCSNCDKENSDCGGKCGKYKLMHDSPSQSTFE
jgi:hypothetical protein